jgi:hypothetical protein
MSSDHVGRPSGPPPSYRADLTETRPSSTITATRRVEKLLNQLAPLPNNPIRSSGPPLATRVLESGPKLIEGPPKSNASGITVTHARIISDNAVKIGGKTIELAPEQGVRQLSGLLNQALGERAEVIDKIRSQALPKSRIEEQVKAFEKTFAFPTVTVTIHDDRDGTSKVEIPVDSALKLRQAMIDYAAVTTERIVGELSVDPHPSMSERDKFNSGCSYLVGRDYLPPSVELGHGWNIVKNASESPYLMFGLTSDVNHTASYAHGGYSSESTKGAVFMPQEWSLFLNDCWVMGGLKGDRNFSGLTLMQHVPGEPDDFSSRGMSNGEIPRFHIISVSVAEITALMEYGYTRVDNIYQESLHDSDAVFMPDESGKEKRANVTMGDLAELRARCALTQASEHITGDYTQVRSILQFLGQEVTSEKSQRAIQTGMIELHREASIPTTEDTANAMARRQVKINNAAASLGLVKHELPHDPLKSLTLSTPKPLSEKERAVAWQEIGNCALYIADKMIATVNEGHSKKPIPDNVAQVMKMDLAREIERARSLSERAPGEPFDFSLTPNIMFFIDARMSGGWMSERQKLSPDTIRLHAAINDPRVTQQFDEAAERHGLTGPQKDYMKGQFAIEMARQLERNDLGMDSMMAHVVTFFEHFNGDPLPALFRSKPKL